MLNTKERLRFSMMSYSELVALSNKKNRRGCANKDALKAQYYIWETHGKQFRGRNEHSEH